jgi:hypothetical protein
MKKIILLALLFVASSQIGAQTRTTTQSRTAAKTTTSYSAPEGALGAGIYIIPQIGFNASTITGTSDLGTSMRLGANVGVMAEFQVSPTFSIQPGIIYSMQGEKLKKSYAGLSGSLTAQLDYINIPIYAKAYVYNGLYFFAGPQFGFNTRAKLHEAANLIIVKTSSDIADLKDYVKDFDFSIGLGLGYQDPSGFMVSANYNIGLTDIVDDNVLGKSSSETRSASSIANTAINLLTDNAKNGVLQINIGYRF